MNAKIFNANELEQISNFCKLIGVCENLITPSDIVCSLNGANIMIFRNKTTLKISSTITAKLNIKEMVISFNK